MQVWADGNTDEEVLGMVVRTGKLCCILRFIGAKPQFVIISNHRVLQHAPISAMCMCMQVCPNPPGVSMLSVYAAMHSTETMQLPGHSLVDCLTGLRSTMGEMLRQIVSPLHDQAHDKDPFLPVSFTHCSKDCIASLHCTSAVARFACGANWQHSARLEFA